MKAIQITIDEQLLSRLDADPEVKRVGRSAVLRRALEAYLLERRKRLVGEAYRRAYHRGGPSRELQGWEQEGTWPEA